MHCGFNLFEAVWVCGMLSLSIFKHWNKKVVLVLWMWFVWEAAYIEALNLFTFRQGLNLGDWLNNLAPWAKDNMNVMMHYLVSSNQVYQGRKVLTQEYKTSFLSGWHALRKLIGTHINREETISQFCYHAAFGRKLLLRKILVHIMHVV